MSIREQIMDLELSLKELGTKIANKTKKSASKSPDIENLLSKKAQAEAELSALLKKSEFTPPGGGEDSLASEDEIGEPDELGEDVDIDEDVDTDLEEDEFGTGNVKDDIAQAVADVLGAEFDDDTTIGEAIDALSSGNVTDDEELDLEEDDDEEFEPVEGEEFEEEAPEEEMMDEEFEEEEEEPEYTVKEAHCKNKNCKCQTMVKRNGKIICKECGSQIVITIDLPEGMDIEGEEGIDINDDGLPEEEKDLGLETGEEAEEDIKEIFEEPIEEETEEVEQEEEEAEETPEEEHEENETGEEEEAEHEGKEKKKKWNFEKASYSAKFYKKPNKAESYWVVFANKTPLFQVKAAKAWKDINATPKAGEFPKKFASYYDVFVDDMYKESLLEHCKLHGWDKTCGLANGKISKSAQVLPEGTIENNAQPSPNTATQDGIQGGVPEGAGTLNPSEATEEVFDAELPSKMLVTDVIANLLAIEVANESYTVDEIETELKAVFSDEEATAEFIGQLQQKADTYRDVVDESGAEEEEPPMDDELADLGAPGMEAQQSQQTTPQMTEPSQPVKVAAKNKCKKCGGVEGLCSCKEINTEKEACSGMDYTKMDGPAKCEKCNKNQDECICDEKEEMKKEAEDLNSLRFKVAGAMKFVKDEMQTRDLVPTVDEFLKQSFTLEAAKVKEQEAVAAEVKKIMTMDKSACENYMDIIKKMPKNAKSNEEDEALIKQANAFNEELGASSKIPFIEKTEFKTGIDAYLPDEMFETRLTKVATDNGKRQKRWG